MTIYDRRLSGWSALSKFMLTAPYYLLYVTRNALQEDSLYKLPRDWREADQAVVPWGLLLAFSEDWCNICFSPLMTDLPQPSWAFKGIECSLATTSVSSLSTLGCGLSGPMDFHGLNSPSHQVDLHLPPPWTLQLVTETWETLLVKTETKKSLGVLGSSVSAVTKSLVIPLLMQHFPFSAFCY